MSPSLKTVCNFYDDDELKGVYIYKFLNVPIFDDAIFAGREEAMRARLTLHGHDSIVVRKQRTMTVAKLETPDAHVLIGAASDEQLAVARRVKRHYLEVIGGEVVCM